jgi:hypothetical protein
MLRPTAEEMQLAEQLGIDYTEMTGPDIREAIRRAKAARMSRVRRHAGMTPGQRRYLELRKIAEELGLAPLEHLQLVSLKAMVERKLQELFHTKGFVADAIIQYAPDAPWYMSKRARIIKTTIVWNKDMPLIVLHMEGSSRTHTYLAHHAVLHAVVCT